MRVTRELRSALASDVVGFVAGLAPMSVHGVPIPIPISTAMAAINLVGASRRKTYVDWDLPDWPTIYHQEVPKTLSLHIRNREFRLPQIIVHENPTGKPVGEFGIRFQLDRTPFVLDPEIAARTEAPFERCLHHYSNKAHFSDERCARMVSSFETESCLIVKVQPAYYTQYLRTNLLLDYNRDRRASIRNMLQSSGALEPLSESRLANVLGINLLVFTADGGLVLPKRSWQVAFRGGEVTPSGSGTVSWLDAEASDGGCVKPVTILREAVEEIGIYDDGETQERLIYLGTTRELVRGGQPEMFFVTTTKLSEREVLERTSVATFKWEVSKVTCFHFGQSALSDLVRPQQMHGFLTSTDTLLEEIFERASIPLLTAVALWIRHKTRQSAERRKVWID